MNALQVRARLESQGSIFQTNSDTEVIVHLIALSKEHTLPEAMADALRRVEGAFSLVMMSNDRIFAVRDPRPMASSPPIITQTYSRRHQTRSFEERPISCPSSLRVLRRQGAAKHKPR